MKKKAFTLAEVLITLGIIGVVAAMTIPTLMANIKSSRYKNQLRKTISTLSQAVRMSQAKYDFDFAGMDQLPSDADKNTSPEDKKSIFTLLNGTLTGARYMGWVSDFYGNAAGKEKITTYSDLETQEGYLWQFADGAIFFFNPGVNKCTKDNKCIGWVDVNGLSLPNKETKCSDGKSIEYIYYFYNNAVRNQNFEGCIVNSKDVGDIYPIFFYDNVIEPATNAGKYVFDGIVQNKNSDY